MSLIISKQLPQTFSDVFAIVTVTNFYTDLRIVSSKKNQGIGFEKKLRRGANIKTFREIKNFLFTSFIWLVYNEKHLHTIRYFQTFLQIFLRAYSHSHPCVVRNGCRATASSGHRTTIVVDPGVIRQLTVPLRFKLT